MNDTLHAIFIDFDKIYNAAAKSVPAPFNPAALDGQDAPLTPEQSSGAVPFVNQQTGD